MTTVERTGTVLIVETAAVDSRRGETIESQPDGQFKAVEGEDDFVRFQVGMTFDDIEREMLLKTLAYHDNNKRKAARTLGVTTKTIYNRLLRYRELGLIGNTRIGEAEDDADHKTLAHVEPPDRPSQPPPAAPPNPDQPAPRPPEVPPARPPPSPPEPPHAASRPRARRAQTRAARAALMANAAQGNTKRQRR